jgi:hypothetical protein
MTPRWDTSIWGGDRRGPLPDPRHSARSAAIDEVFITRCLALWDCRFDTDQIAKMLGDREAAVAAAVRIGRERRLV